MASAAGTRPAWNHPQRRGRAHPALATDPLPPHVGFTVCVFSRNGGTHGRRPCDHAGNGHFAACHFAGKLQGSLAEKVAQESVEAVHEALVSDIPGSEEATPGSAETAIGANGSS